MPNSHFTKWYLMPLKLVVALCFVLINIQILHAQDLTLFEAFENGSESSTESQSDVVGSRVAESSAVFKLVGATRIGNKRQVHLGHRSGETITVTVLDGRQTSVPGYEDYVVEANSTKRITLIYPQSQLCQVFPDSGVGCQNRNTAVLTFAVSEPISSPQVDDGQDEQQEAEEAPDNPFARIRAANAADNPASDPNSQRFRPRRIPPEDVPEGMRVISTPFGDRLVQE